MANISTEKPPLKTSVRKSCGSVFIPGKRGNDIGQAMNSDFIILCLWVDFTTSPRDYVLTNEVVALHDCANIHVECTPSCGQKEPGESNQGISMARRRQEQSENYP